jgi:AraC family transcriptional regulator of adaptative response / DNA-3-methyladenine glycosylase II
LRARRRRADRLVADGGLPLRLAFTGPLDWPALLDYFAARAIPGVEHVEGDTYRRTIVVDGHPGVLELWPGGADHLVLCAHLPRWDELVHIVQRARRIGSLDLWLDEPLRALADDPALGALLRRRPGLRPPGSWDAFETGVRAIVGQHITHGGANRLSARLVARFGTRVPGLERLGLTHTFPAPSALARADLERVGLARARAATIRTFARAVAADEIRLDRSVSLDELVASMTSHGGLDDWTAHYIALRLGEPDACPRGDLLAGQAERWRPWRALGATHLWLVHEPPEADSRVRGAA